MGRRPAAIPDPNIGMQVAIYARVSTQDQTCAMQLSELRDYCKRRKWMVAKEYVDRGWSGTSRNRPQLQKLMEDASQHKCDCVLVWKLDRFSRSMLHLHEQLLMLRSAGVRFIATSQNIDTDESNPTSRLLLNILAAIAEFERELIRERTVAGIRSYKKAYDEGRVGRKKEVQSKTGKNQPHGRPRRIVDRMEIQMMLREGLSIRDIARRLKIGIGTAHRAAQVFHKPVLVVDQIH